MLLALGCTEPAAESAPVDDTPPPAMEIDRLAARLSLDLVGRRPTEAELDALEADPTTLDAQIDTWLADPDFEERVVSLYADVYRSRADHYVVGADGDIEFLDTTYRAQFMRSVGEEPLRLLARVAAEDLPWTDVVTADWSMGNELLLHHFPIEAITPDGEGWRPVRYLDNRPAVGVLGTNGMWWRYTSTADNANRGRAAALSRVLLCDERYERPVDFKKSNASVDVTERIASDPSCVGCHSTLDPLASTLYGFWRHHPESYTEALRYYTSREQDWVAHTNVPPAYYGQDVSSLYEVGRAVADDPRFVNCAVKQVWGFLLHRQPEVADLDRFTEDRAAFLESGLQLRAAFRAVADDPWYRSDAGAWEGTTPARALTPDQLASSVEALTGYRWSVAGGIDAMVNDDYGYRVLDGGIDGILVTEAPTTETATVALVQERLAEAAGGFAIETELSQAPEDRVLFRETGDLLAVPTDADLRTQIVHLVRRVLGRRIEADSAEADALVALWSDIQASAGTAPQTWAFFLSALLRHPDFVHV
jgi:hypothetical protein